MNCSVVSFQGVGTLPIQKVQWKMPQFMTGINNQPSIYPECVYPCCGICVLPLSGRLVHFGNWWLQNHLNDDNMQALKHGRPFDVPEIVSAMEDCVSDVGVWCAVTKLITLKWCGADGGRICVGSRAVEPVDVVRQVVNAQSISCLWLHINVSVGAGFE